MKKFKEFLNESWWNPKKDKVSKRGRAGFNAKDFIQLLKHGSVTMDVVVSTGERVNVKFGLDTDNGDVVVTESDIDELIQGPHGPNRGIVKSETNDLTVEYLLQDIGYDIIDDLVSKYKSTKH